MTGGPVRRGRDTDTQRDDHAGAGRARPRPRQRDRPGEDPPADTLTSNFQPLCENNAVLSSHRCDTARKAEDTTVGLTGQLCLGTAC